MEELTLASEKAEQLNNCTPLEFGHCFSLSLLVFGHYLSNAINEQLSLSIRLYAISLLIVLGITHGCSLRIAAWLTALLTAVQVVMLCFLIFLGVRQLVVGVH